MSPPAAGPPGGSIPATVNLISSGGTPAGGEAGGYNRIRTNQRSTSNRINERGSNTGRERRSQLSRYSDGSGVFVMSLVSLDDGNVMRPDQRLRQCGETSTGLETGWMVEYASMAIIPQTMIAGNRFFTNSTPPPYLTASLPVSRHQGQSVTACRGFRRDCLDHLHAANPQRTPVCPHRRLAVP